MDADLAALPDDIDALKAALMIERARMREVAAERDVRGAELAVAPVSYTHLDVYKRQRWSGDDRLSLECARMVGGRAD